MPRVSAHFTAWASGLERAISLVTVVWLRPSDVRKSSQALSVGSRMVPPPPLALEPDKIWYWASAGGTEGGGRRSESCATVNLVTKAGRRNQ